MEKHLEQLGKVPKRILMIKGHSAGIGDILRGSAAWRALTNTFPGVELHLVLFTQDPGYASESFIARHHLLRGFHSVDKKMGRLRAWPRLSAWADHLAEKVQPDLVIDFEWAGLYSAFTAWRFGQVSGALTAGVDEFPTRAAFYNIVSSSKNDFARRRGLSFPLEYAYRDFVCLSALKIERNGLPIELEETNEGRAFRETFREKFHIPGSAPIIGLNIGCGTPASMWKRPKLELLCAVVAELQKAHDAVVVLTGAKFEREVNHEFIKLWPANRRHLLFDLAGQTNLLELSGLIRACDLFISTDSGPYHMSVALKVPTLAVFRGPPGVHGHCEKHVRCIVLAKEEQIGSAIEVGRELFAAR